MILSEISRKIRTKKSVSRIFLSEINDKYVQIFQIFIKKFIHIFFEKNRPAFVPLPQIFRKLKDIFLLLL